MRNKQVLLASRPTRPVDESIFRIVESDVGPVGEGHVLTRIHYLSVDPYMRMRMEAAKSYAAPQPVGEVMIGGTVGEVIESRHPQFRRGDMVVGMGGWQQYHLGDGTALRKVDTSVVPASAYLGPVGMPGITAWYGLTHIGKPRPGETVLVSAAAGAVGSVAGQLARLMGCRAVGIAGGPAKCDHVVRDLGFDAAADHRAPDFDQQLAGATPTGVDVVFENVGGTVLDLALTRMNPYGRVVLCGAISGYDRPEPPLRNARSILVNRLSVQGFIVSEHVQCWPHALSELGAYVAVGKIRYRETVAHGLENAPRAFLGLLRGENIGKQLVKLV
jgi:NADPH-dependent curcumin reductase CurA